MSDTIHCGFVAILGVPNAVPVPGGDPQVLRARARAVRQSVVRQLRTLDAPATSPVETADAATLLARTLDRLNTIFFGTLRVLPRLQPTGRETLLAALTASVVTQGGDPHAARSWLGDMSRVRAPVDRFHTLLDDVESLGGTGLGLHVAQLPFDPGMRWCALPPADGLRPADGTLSLVAHLPEPLDSVSPLAGLWLDEWVEVIPAREVNTGLTFSFDEPGAQAPQAILLAVPPDARARWEITTLEAIALETFELARLRAVDPEALEQHTDLDQLLPALSVPLNLQGDTISTDFSRLVAAPV